MNRLSIRTYPLDELVALARRNAPFYQEAYAHLPERPTLTDLPVLDTTKFWEAHTRSPREIITGPLEGGIVLNSGGSTGAPKFSYFRDDEVDTSVALTAHGLEGTGLRDGDRVGNLFANGYLYASFGLVTEALKETSAKVLQFPIGYFVPIPDAVRIIRGFRINVWAGFPTHLMNLLNYLEKEKIEDVQVSRIIFGGEPFTPEQRSQLSSRFPGVEIRSISYASVDGGIIAFAPPDCGPGEHRVADGAALMEIHDEETGEVIEETGRAGKIIFTNLTRRLMPMLRYPTGDRGEWCEPAGTAARKFVLLGRTEESVRLGSFNITVAEMAALLEPFRAPLEIRHFQLVVAQEGGRDGLTLRLVGNAPAAAREAGQRTLIDTFLQQKPVLAEAIKNGVVRPIAVEWIEPSQLEVNTRTGKTPAVIDRRAR